MDNIRLPRGWSKDNISNNKTKETQYLLKPPLEVPQLPQKVDPTLKQKLVNENHPPLEPVPPKSLKSEEKPYFKSIKIYLTDNKRVCEVCRICFCAIQDADMFKLAQEPNEDVAQLKNMLKQVLPDLDLAVYQNSVVCKKCKELLVSSFELKATWLATEEKLRAIIEKQKGDPKKCLMLVAGTVAKKAPRATTQEAPIFVKLLKKPAGRASSRHVDKERRAERAVGPLLCDQCGHTLYDKRSLQRHQQTHKKREERRIEMQKQSMCERCGQIFDTLAKMKKHVYLKHNRKSYEHTCYVCGKSVQYLAKHVKSVHAYEFTQCHLCGERVRKASLNVHLKGHNQKMHACQFCNKRFHYSRSLRGHLLTHGNDDLACEICGILFKHRKSLNKHVRIVHRKEGATCEICAKPYYKESDLVKHMNRKHGMSEKQQEND